MGALTIGILRIARQFDPTKTANLFARITRSIGPMMREQKTDRTNLIAAFPEKSPAEIETILAGVSDNLGRVGAEFAHLDHIWNYDPARPEDSRIEIDKRSYDLFAQLRLDGKPALIFASHLAAGNFRPWQPSRTGWIPRFCIADPTSRPPTASSRICAP
ncbi:lauroyl/myristoyl acyltransferase [Bradyrhizobium japonicum]|nr:lauroyl/myristoyl acyltransferase [Bradyrhizobium japonicum]MCS3962444.1 lauroyl/myristoyl acyltransferase [Bradyrhizobium japonicum]MCS3994761.1 lauroyl/myristoyl acyltransferase [Bradyrhizobium japonicum]